jgi:PAS domain S-box-containing protein
MTSSRRFLWRQPYVLLRCADVLVTRFSKVQHTMLSLAGVDSVPCFVRGQILMFQDSNVLDLSREDMAVISISQSLNRLGCIDSANPVALAMFGYNKRDLLGKNIAMLVPPPMNARHDGYLRAYLDSGRSAVGAEWVVRVCVFGCRGDVSYIGSLVDPADDPGLHTNDVREAQLGRPVSHPAVCEAVGQLLRGCDSAVDDTRPVRACASLVGCRVGAQSGRCFHHHHDHHMCLCPGSCSSRWGLAG